MRSAWGLDTDLGRKPHWSDQAACRGHDPEWWVVDGRNLSDENLVAQAICRNQCPVRAECKAAGIETGARNTIYGGEVMPVGVQTEGPLSTKQAGLLANCAAVTIRVALLKGQLRGWRTDKGWRIDPDALDEWLRTNKRGTPSDWTLPAEDPVVRGRTIASLTQQGKSAQEIATELGMSRRQIVRYRQGQARRAQAVDNPGKVA